MQKAHDHPSASSATGGPRQLRDSNSLPASHEAALADYLALPVEDHIARWAKQHENENSANDSTESIEDMLAQFNPTTVLDGRYLLRRSLSSDSVSQVWLGSNQDETPFLIRLWPYDTERPDEPARALWHSELRLLYRLGSSRNAQRTILTLREAGIDRTAKAFVMVMQSSGGGYERLSSLLGKRSEHPWLGLASLRDSSARSRIWDNLHRLATGIEALHNQRVIHRNVSAETVYLDPDGGPESWRLGGFEWSIRLGSSAELAQTPHSVWVLPPEVYNDDVGLTFYHDWYGFGMLLAQCFYPLQIEGINSSTGANELVREMVRNNHNGLLTEQERDFILALTTADPSERLVYAEDILTTCSRIAKDLDCGHLVALGDKPLVVVFNPASEDILKAARAAGFQADPDPNVPFSTLNSLHVMELKEFLRIALSDCRLYPGRDAKTFVLVGKAPLTFLIGRFSDQFNQTQTWQHAILITPWELRSRVGESTRDLRSIKVLPVTLADRRNYTNSQSWEPFLPRRDEAEARAYEVERFHSFLRCTNQLELLMRCAEVFAYQVENNAGTNREGIERLVIRETADPNRVFPRFCRVEGGLIGHLNRELQTGSGKLYLTDTAELRVPNIRPELDAWEILPGGIDELLGTIQLQRPKSNHGTPAPDSGYVRTHGLYGQVTLIERRKRAIDRLSNHDYLLSALAQPGQVSMDTGFSSASFELPLDQVDDSKRAVIEDIERVRPIYALQGPPGTGKTTLVAFFLRRLFGDDDLAQVLVTAQAHEAVDVLLRKVRDDAFKDLSPDLHPLAIRLGSKDSANEDSVESVSEKLLEGARRKLLALNTRVDIQERWLQVVEAFLSQPKNEQNVFASDFAQLVKRSAAITYCTTSAGDLSDLAAGTESFDWSFDWAIVEEAGKVHGFDLALPLQTGHRWLLLGDQYQLDPFKVENFVDGLTHLESAVESLWQLGAKDRALLDIQFVQSWRDEWSSEEKSLFASYCQNCLRVFARLFRTLSQLRADERITTDVAIGAHAGRLSQQWRMHPFIGDLISNTFYKGAITNGTVDASGLPSAAVQHRVRIAALPDSLQPTGKSIVWLDTPWCLNNADWAESGGMSSKKPRYSNDREIELIAELLRGIVPPADADLKVAVLSPYSVQVGALNRRLDGLPVADGIHPASSTMRRNRLGVNTQRWAHTVDSFQGNQADIVIVSLVRNNGLLAGSGLGFLDIAQRINVLLSRAEQLMILVGSWDFFQAQVKGVSLDNTDDRIWFWKSVLSTVENGCAQGQALRISANALLKTKS